MNIQLRPGELVVRFGSRFDSTEVARVAEAMTAFAPVSALTLDFAATREFRDAAVAPLATQISASGATLRLRGLTRHQSRMFQYFGHDGGERPLGDGTAGEAA